MFRRNQKATDDQPVNLYNEEKKMPSYQYTKENEDKTAPPRLFDPPHNPAHPPKINSQTTWTEKNSLPHHFQELIKEETPETTLGESVEVIGQLKFEKLLKIDGVFEGELISKGKVIIGPTGRVKANLNLNEAIIEGHVEGDITCADRIELKGQASIHGNIKTKSLVIDEGVVIIGHVEITHLNKDSLVDT